MKEPYRCGLGPTCLDTQCLNVACSNYWIWRTLRGVSEVVFSQWIDWVEFCGVEFSQQWLSRWKATPCGLELRLFRGIQWSVRSFYPHTAGRTFIRKLLSYLPYSTTSILRRRLSSRLIRERKSNYELNFLKLHSWACGMALKYIYEKFVWLGRVDWIINRGDGSLS
jgi:hypothetical protein